jgi:hypothetical protein
MTLFNVGKSAEDRSNPSINSVDVKINPSALNTASISPRASGTQIAGKITTKDSQIIANDGAYDIIKLGQQSNGGYGLIFSNGANTKMYIGKDGSGNYIFKVAKDGFDADTATNDQLIFNSAQDTFKIVGKYTASFSATCAGFNESNTLFSITHNLGYQPLYIASVAITTNTLNGVTGTYPIPYLLPAGSNNTTGNNIWGFLAGVVPYTVSNTTIQFEAVVGSQNGSGQTIAGTVTVYVLQETAN